MSLKLSAVICTHNPRPEILAQTLRSLQDQDPIDGDDWELILIDNASVQPLDGRVDLGWHERARVVREDRLGLTHARLRAFAEAQGEILVFIDDDNILDPDYLQQAAAAMQADPTLGAIGGRSIPRYEVPPAAWFNKLGISLACQDFGDRPRMATWAGVPEDERAYPDFAPIGAGMVIRRDAYAAYVQQVRRDPLRQALGRKGANLASGEDNDIVMCLLSEGWRIGYAPQLRLVHLIPATRLTRKYLANYAYSSNLTWVQVLDVHGIRPWEPVPRWTSPLRKARAYLRFAAWRDDPNYVRWRGACGVLDGRARLGRAAKR